MGQKTIENPNELLWMFVHPTFLASIALLPNTSDCSREFSAKKTALVFSHIFSTFPWQPLPCYFAPPKLQNQTETTYQSWHLVWLYT